MLQATTHLADITPEIAISALVASEGNRRLAAERLSKQLQIHITPSNLSSIITGDPLGFESVAAQLRLSALLQTYDLLSKLMLVLNETIGDLSPKELSTTTSNILNIFNSLTSSSQALTANVNVTEVVLKMLPPEAREAVLQLTALPSNGAPT